MSSPAPSLGVNWYNGLQVGRVVVPGEPRFGYLPEWLKNGYSLSPIKVPFELSVHRVRAWEFDQLPGFIADCIPDQWGRKIMAADLARHELKPTPLNMLAWVGERGIGALKFLPPISEDGSSDKWEAVEPLFLARQAQEVVKKSPPEAFEFLLKAGTAGGAFPKANVAMLPDKNLLCGGNITHELQKNYVGARLGILKIDSEDDPARTSTDGRLECAYMEMARAAGIRTANAEVLSDAAGNRVRNHLFVERFDVSASHDHRLHLVSLAGLLESFSLTYAELFSACRQLTENREELLEAVKRMVFNARAGNADDHGKNHSFVFDDRDLRWRLSPAYDLTLNYSDDRTFNGLLHQTFGATPRLAQLRSQADQFAVTAAEFDSIDAAVKTSITAWPTFAKKAGLDQAEVDRVSELHRRIEDQMSTDGSRSVRKRPRLF
ncbi:hypothetical protein CMV30_12965 [Nibricoccus aquaticus]|uniref:Phosphatidylinositol kinase n=1 Tax=Nibricoccus aquaticus TaxID=2576891 RepID=A0A290Q8N5_9BACT|nr:type II toxin-antitoxin system HipA family toxin [Nibricoccus aquaticus]ATC64803.1 hypothetical protein CMV30_12965 [Nibricoccus aquaticus]